MSAEMARTLITFSSFSGPLTPRMESLWRSCTWKNMESQILYICASFVLRLTHKTTEALESTRDTNMGVNLDQHTASRVYVDLQKSSLVQWRIQEGQEALSENFF